jgi:hypothetical protein
MPLTVSTTRATSALIRGQLCGHKNDDGKVSSGEILLISKFLVSRE